MKKNKGFNPNAIVKIEITPNMLGVELGDIVFKYKHCGQVDCEFIRLMSVDELMSLLYNLSTNIFDIYGYSNIPYRQYNNGEKHSQIKVLHTIKYTDVPKIKQMLCQ